MKRAYVWSMVLMALTFGAASAATVADISITGTDAPIALESIVGTPTLITVVLKESGARDPNLQLTELYPDRIVVLSPTGDVIPYMAESVESIEVQGGTVEPRRVPQMDAHMLRVDHQRVVDRAWARVREIYQESDSNQELKIEAATLLALSNDSGAHNYLRQLAESNDVVTQLAAAGALFLVGDAVSETLIREGLGSGNRTARVKGASLAGLTGYRESAPLLQVMFRDRAVQLSTPAARALARLGVREIVPDLITMLYELHTEKGEAAIFALTRLADDSVVEQLKFRLLEAEGITRLRLVRVLFNLDDPVGISELKHIYQSYPTLAPDVALLLAKHGDWEATQYLRGRLSRREDPTDANLSYRARNAQALLYGGDPSAMAVFQELLRTGNDEITTLVFELMTELGQPRLITLLQPGIENVDKEFALSACMAVISLALPDFRARLLEYREEFGD